MRWVGSGNAGYTATRALLFVTLSIPGHLYELMPIAVLIGAIFVMAKFAQSSEFTIMRTSGMGPWLALRTLLVLGMSFVVLTVLVGDYIAPAADNFSQKLRVVAKGQISRGATGAWLKESKAITPSLSTSVPSRPLEISSMCAFLNSTARAASLRRSTLNLPRSMKTRSCGP